LKVTPLTTTAATPKGTLPVGETTSALIAPLVGVTAAWFVATPPTVMLFAGIVAELSPCASTMIDVGAVPMKLKVVAPLMVL